VTVTIGLAGAGRRAADVHAPSLASCPGARFAGIWAPRAQAAGALADKHAVAAFERFDEMLDQCDAVVFAVPPAAQPEIAGLAAARGKAVLLEIPIAGDLAGAQELAEAIGTAGVVSQVALTWRYASEIRRFLDTAVPHTRPLGGSGRLISAAFRPESSASAWRAEMGVLRNLGPHLVDMLDAALGRIDTVRAHGDPRGWVGLMLEHANGRFSEASLTAAAKVDAARAYVEVFGGGGSAEIECEAAAGRDAFTTMFAEFAQAVTAGTPPGLDVQRGLHLQRVVEEAQTDLIRTA
jgi:predicted dehydrogenase